MTPLRLAEAIKSARPLPGASSPMYLRTFRITRPFSEHRFTFRPLTEALDSAATRESLSSGISFERIPPDRLSDYGLIVNVGGEFQTVDELRVEDASISAAETFVKLALTSVESAEGEPALVDVFLILPMTPEIANSGRVRLTFSVSRRSFEGQVTALENAIPDCVVPLV